jgi:hypothetical protein
MIEKTQLRHLISIVLKDMEPEIPYSETAVNLLMLTAAVESNLGTYIEQIGGPARGIFQMEPATEEDIWINYLAYKPNLKNKVESYMSDTKKIGNHMVWNYAYAIAMARLKYLRDPNPLPNNTKDDLAKCWKRVYNTSLGRGTVEKAIKKYEDLVEV